MLFNFVKNILISLLLFISFSAACQKENFKIKKVKEKSGYEIHYFYLDNKLIKKELFKNGLRDSISEEYREDTISNEFQRIVNIYEKGILKEELAFSRDSILLTRYVYTYGRLDYSIELIRVDKQENLVYIKKVYQLGNFMQYTIINSKVIDSVFVNF